MAGELASQLLHQASHDLVGLSLKIDAGANDGSAARTLVAYTFVRRGAEGHLQINWLDVQ